MLKPPLQPMLLTTLEKPFDSEEYLFEIKWDGYRSLVFINNNKVFLQSRNQKDLTPYFPELEQIHNNVKKDNIILDGEICFLDQEGKPVFEYLQSRLGRKNNSKIRTDKTAVTLIIWDILAYNNKDISGLPLIKRKNELEELVEENSLLQISKYIEKEGKKLYQAAREEKLEGIVAKKIDSPYEFKRSRYWYKIKIWQYTEVIIGGYSRDKTSLIIGKPGPGESLSYMGRIKIALNETERKALFKFLPEIEINDCPFNNDIESDNLIWVKPALKCRVRYTELTTNNTFRHGFAVKLITGEN